MSTHNNEETLREAARMWFAHARSDLAVARSPSQPADVLPETLCFHAQQAVEKAIKAVLVVNGIDFPKSHDIAELRRLLPQRYNQDARLLDAASLTDYAVAARYPGEREPLDKKDVVAAVKIAAAVLAWAESSTDPAPPAGDTSNE